MGRAVARWLLIEGKKRRRCEGEYAQRKESEKRREEADPIEQNRLMETAEDTLIPSHKHADKATWRYIKLEAISSKPVA